MPNNIDATNILEKHTLMNLIYVLSRSLKLRAEIARGERIIARDLTGIGIGVIVPGMVPEPAREISEAGEVGPAEVYVAERHWSG